MKQAEGKYFLSAVANFTRLYEDLVELNKRAAVLQDEMYTALGRLGAYGETTHVPIPNAGDTENATRYSLALWKETKPDKKSLGAGTLSISKGKWTGNTSMEYRFVLFKSNPNSFGTVMDGPILPKIYGKEDGKLSDGKVGTLFVTEDGIVEVRLRASPTTNEVTVKLELRPGTSQNPKAPDMVGVLYDHRNYFKIAKEVVPEPEAILDYAPGEPADPVISSEFMIDDDEVPF